MITLLTIIATSVGIDPTLLKSICWVETNHRNVINQDDGGSPSYGLCQVKLETAQWLQKRHRLPIVTNANLMIEETNALYAALYLKYQQTRYDDVECVISAYNAGSCIESNKPTYVRKVKKRMAHYTEE